MKRISLLLAMFMTISLVSNAQWNTNGTHIYNTNTGNVGIGTSTPTADLHISKSNSGPKILIENTSSVSTTYPGIDINNYQGSTSGHPYLTFSNAKGTKVSPAAIGGTLLGTLVFSGHNGVSLVQAARMEVSAEVPFTSTSTPTSMAFLTTNPNSISYSEKMRITSTGNVGIGTSSPNALLEVRTNLPSTAKYNSQLWTTDNNGYNLKLQTTWDANGITQQFIQRFSGVDYTALSFCNGNVGIGSMIPDAKLTVKGTIHSQEVKVDLSVPGPDYVFEETYKLPSLTDTENYIKQNKHLPEVPSACEMEEKGINLSEMNMILLKKVEELTLYVIELKKRDELQQKEIEELKIKK